MKKWACLFTVLMFCFMSTVSFASGWVVPGRNGNYDSGDSSFSGISVRLTDDLATRSGPSTGYTGCGSYRMKGQYVTALSRSYDNGGVLWIEIEFQYGGGYRRAWTGAKRLEISQNQLKQIPEEDFSTYIGYGTLTGKSTPRFGPGSLYATYGDRDFRRGDQVVAIREVNGYYLVECYHMDGNILRCWVSTSDVRIN